MARLTAARDRARQELARWGS